MTLSSLLGAKRPALREIDSDYSQNLFSASDHKLHARITVPKTDFSGLIQDRDLVARLKVAHFLTHFHHFA